jgi:hypothetical protein
VTIVSGSVPIPEIALVAAADGTVSLDLPDGTFRLRAHTGDGRSGETTIESRSTEFVIRIGFHAAPS